MAGKSNYLEALMLNTLFRTLGASTTRMASGVFIALLTAAPTDAGGGTEVSTSGSAYARKAVTQNDANWSAPSGTPRMISNAVAIDFLVPTANWGVITHFAIYDAVTAGNLLYWAALTTPKTVNTADSAPSFAIGALTITED